MQDQRWNSKDLFQDSRPIHNDIIINESFLVPFYLFENITAECILATPLPSHQDVVDSFIYTWDRVCAS